MVFSYIFPNLVYAEMCHSRSVALSADIRNGAPCAFTAAIPAVYVDMHTLV